MRPWQSPQQQPGSYPLPRPNFRTPQPHAQSPHRPPPHFSMGGSPSGGAGLMGSGMYSNPYASSPIHQQSPGGWAGPRGTPRGGRGHWQNNGFNDRRRTIGGPSPASSQKWDHSFNATSYDDSSASFISTPQHSMNSSHNDSYFSGAHNMSNSPFQHGGKRPRNESFRSNNNSLPWCLQDPWGNLAPTPAPLGGSGLVTRGGQRHSVLTPQKAAHASSIVMNSSPLTQTTRSLTTINSAVVTAASPINSKVQSGDRSLMNLPSPISVKPSVLTESIASVTPSGDESPTVVSRRPRMMLPSPVNSGDKLSIADEKEKNAVKNLPSPPAEWTK